VQLAADENKQYATTAHVTQLKSYKILTDVDQVEKRELNEHDEQLKSAQKERTTTRARRTITKPTRFKEFKLY